MRIFFINVCIVMSAVCLAQQPDQFIRVSTGTNTEFNKYHKGKASFLSIQDNMKEEGEQAPDPDQPAINPEILKRKIPFEKKEQEFINPKLKLPFFPPRNIFYPDIPGVDPMIAAGHQYLIISQDHFIVFYNKKGYPLPEKVGGIKTSWSSTEFFQPIIDAANANHFAFLANAPDDILTKCQSGGNVSSSKILNEAYDTRVIYEPTIRRFIIASAVRNPVWQNGNYADLCRKNAIRIFAFAISNTEDPRDGFKMWYWTKNNYRDWPRISADQDVFTVAHNGSGSENTPSIYAISIEDMMNGVSNLRWFVYTPSKDDAPISVLPVNKFVDKSSYDKYVMFLKSDGEDAILYYYRKSPGMWNNKPELKETDIDLGTEVKLSWHERPVFRDGCIFFTSIVKTANSIINFRPSIYGFDLYRLPLKLSDGEIEFNESSSRKLEYPVYPMVASTSEFVSYELPSLCVDERATILVAYGRWGKKNSGSIPPEARYFTFFNNEDHHRPSNLLKEGTYMPQYTPPNWTTTTVDGFYNADGDAMYGDYTTVAADPEDRFIFWIAHLYAEVKENRYKLVVGKVMAN